MKSLRIFLAASIFLMSLAASADNVTFSYEGRVKVNGSPFNGTGQFKFAIMNTSGTETLWSNDGTASGEPATAISLAVSEGVFSVVVGDASLGMTPINSSVFASHTPLKLRVWFNGSGLGFQQLNPDQNLVDLTLNTISTGDSDYTIYVNGTTGSDGRNGLTPATAKKTIQAGVDIVPTKLRCVVTIKISPGVYKERVSLSQVSGSGGFFNGSFEGSFLKLVGDETWTTTSVGSPNVRIIGADVDATTAPRLRLYSLSAQNCTAVEFQGLGFDLPGHSGVDLKNGSYIFQNCMAQDAPYAGFFSEIGAYAIFYNCVSNNNTNHGFYGSSAINHLYGCVSKFNAFGLFVQGPGYANVYGGNVFSNNSLDGIAARDLAMVGFGGGLPTTQVQSNARNGVNVITGSIGLFLVNATITGNTTANTTTNPGGSFY